MKIKNGYLTEEFAFWEASGGWYMGDGLLPIKLTKKQVKDLKLEEWSERLKGITSEEVKKIRDLATLTGVSLMNCKKFLIEANWDSEIARKAIVDFYLAPCRKSLKPLCEGENSKEENNESKCKY